MLNNIHDGERVWLASIVENLSDDTRKLIYADWLDDQGDDKRAKFLRDYVVAIKSMKLDDFPTPAKFEEEWLDLIGFRLMEHVAKCNLPEFKKPFLRCARPALRYTLTPVNREPAIGASKYGGRPDLPPGFSWPLGRDCKAIYNDDTDEVEEYAGFICQVNCEEISGTLAAKDLPKTGLLSFFGYIDIENDCPDTVGVCCFYFANTSDLNRAKAPHLTEGNEIMDVQKMRFQECLDIPESDGIWQSAMHPKIHQDKDFSYRYQHFSKLFDHFRSMNFHNLMGYARSTSGGDPTPNKRSRHMIVFDNAAGCRLHIQIDDKHLRNFAFDKIKLVWVDFD